MPYIIGEIIQCPVFYIAPGKGGRHTPGPADLLKTISIGLIAGGLIFKGLICPFRLVNQNILP